MKTVEQYRKNWLQERLKENIQEDKSGNGCIVDLSRFKEFSDE